MPLFLHCFIWLFSLLTAFDANASSVESEVSQPFQSQLLAQHNAARAKQKIAPLALDRCLSKAAQAHADHMAATGKFAHTEIGNGTIASRIDDAGYNWKTVGENIAWNKDNSQLPMKLWLNSQPHRKQLFAAYQHVGFGRTVAKDGKIYWVACFATPLR